MTAPIAAEGAAGAWPVQTAADVLGAADTAWLGGIVQSVAFPDSFIATRTPMITDAYGGETPDPAHPPFTSAYGACLLKPTLSQAEVLIAQRLTISRPAVIWLPVGSDVTEKDRLSVNGSRTFEVSEVAVGGNFALFTPCMCSEVL